MPTPLPHRGRSPALGALLGVITALGCTEPIGRPPAADPVVPPFTVLGHWMDPSAIPYGVDPTGGPVEARAFEAAIERALRIWSETGRVGFVSAGTGEHALLFHWDDGSNPETTPFGRDTSVAVTRRPGEPDEPYETAGLCEVIFDASREWDVDGGAGVDLYLTALHEIGHALGLGHNEDLRSVLHPQRETGGAVLGVADLAGIHSLYGGGTNGPGDLHVEARNEHGQLVLRRVAPPGISAWAVFDTDGDGDDEILVWSVEGDHGSLTAYHFGAGRSGPVLVRTLGPLLGVAGYGAGVRPWVAPDGARHLDVTWPDGTAVRRTFDERGEPRKPAPITDGWTEGGDLDEAELARAGDLDGDGDEDRVSGRP